MPTGWDFDGPLSRLLNSRGGVLHAWVHWFAVAGTHTQRRAAGTVCWCDSDVTALGIALVKPCVVGTTARASNPNVRSIGYSIYYTLVNIGGALGPFVASFVHRHMSVENVFRVSAVSVFVMFFAVVIFFREPSKSNEAKTESIAVTIRNFGKVISNPKFMLFLLIFSGYWIVYWQEFITLPDIRARLRGSQGGYGEHAFHWPADSDRIHGALQRADAKDDGISRGCTRYIHRHDGVFDSGGAYEHLGHVCGAGGDCHRRIDSAAAVLRLHFAAGSCRATGDVYGIRVFAAGDWIVSGRTDWRSIAASLWRSAAPAANVFVGADGDWVSDDFIVVDL